MNYMLQFPEAAVKNERTRRAGPCRVSLIHSFCEDRKSNGKPDKIRNEKSDMESMVYS